VATPRVKPTQICALFVSTDLSSTGELSSLLDSLITRRMSNKTLLEQLVVPKLVEVWTCYHDKDSEVQTVNYTYTYITDCFVFICCPS
jgi:hypothetical protein